MGQVSRFGKQEGQPPQEGIVEYRCACSEILIQTTRPAKITPERIQRIECPRCHARYQRVIKPSKA